MKKTNNNIYVNLKKGLLLGGAVQTPVQPESGNSFYMKYNTGKMCLNCDKKIKVL